MQDINSINDENVEDIDENGEELSHDEIEELVDASGKKIYKRKFGSGTKSATSEKRMRCPICKYHYKRLNEQHLIHIHKMTLEDLEKTNPEYVRYFIDPDYCLEQSGFGKHTESNIQLGDGLTHDEHIHDENCNHSGFKASEGVEWSSVEEYFHKVIDGICEHTGHDRDDVNFTDTPKRVAKAWAEELYGMKNTEDQLKEIFKDSSQFPSKYDGVVTECNIRSYGKCPHHFAQIQFNVHIAYKPKEKKVGLSKLSRCVDVLCSRLVLHETAAQDIADAVMKYLEPEGCAVIVEGVHDCLRVRGAKQENVNTICTTLKGCFKYNPDIKSEFFNTVAMCKKQN